MDTCAPRILVIDPHPITREGVVIVISASLAGSEVTGCANFQEALNVIDAVSADVVITDFRVQGDTALTLLRTLKVRTSMPRCLILSASDEIQVGYPCIKAGASGFVGKSLPISIIAEAVRVILSGHHYISERLSKVLMDGRGAENSPSPGIRLTASELRIFSRLGQCMTVSSIAGKLGISVKTVETHRENIKNKLGLQTAAQVVAAAVRWLDDTSVFF